jgi:thioredoxin-related protein
MKNHYITLLMVLLGILPFGAGCQTKTENAGKWMKFEEAVKLNETNPEKAKKIFVDVYTDWCGWCKKMDANTFSQPEIWNYMSQKFHMVKLDAEMKEEVTVGGHTFKSQDPANKRSSHELAIALLNGQMSYPTVVFLDEKMNMITPVPGYQEPAGFRVIMHFIGDDAYKNKSFEEFKKTFQ